MDPRQMLEAHIRSGAGVTVAGIRVRREEATAFGVIQTTDGTKIDAFLEKPEDPPGLPGPPGLPNPPGLPDSPDQAYVSMGNYAFSAQMLGGRAARRRREHRLPLHNHPVRL